MDLLTSIAVFKCPQLYFSEVDDSKSYLQEVAKRMLTKKGEKRILNYDIEFTSKTIGNYFSRGTKGDLIKKTLILAVPQILENGVVIYDWASPHLDKNINKVEFLMVAAPVVLCKKRYICVVTANKLMDGSKRLYSLNYYKMQDLREFMVKQTSVVESFDIMANLINYILQNTSKQTIDMFVSGGEPWGTKTAGKNSAEPISHITCYKIRRIVESTRKKVRFLFDAVFTRINKEKEII